MGIYSKTVVITDRQLSYIELQHRSTNINMKLYTGTCEANNQTDN